MNTTSPYEGNAATHDFAWSEEVWHCKHCGRAMWQDELGALKGSAARRKCDDPERDPVQIIEPIRTSL